jgi:HK97 family phage major capsid protein
MSPAGEPATPRPGCKLEVAALSLLEELRQRRSTARESADAILTRAQEETRDLSAEELAEFTGHVATQREVEDEIERRRDEELAELRAGSVRRPSPSTSREPVLTREQSVYDWLQHRGAFDDHQDQPLSLQRYLRGMATARWDGATHERALAEATIGAGGALVPAPLSARVIDLARNQTRVFQAGAITVPMTSQTLALARLTGEGSPPGVEDGRRQHHRRGSHV